ncbi:MAG TPA: hypothetical protein VKY51_02880 [Fredinandcohnia sp.]|nr:hypothetical protein [Fredinandcohnia sp.]
MNRFVRLLILAVLVAALGAGCGNEFEPTSIRLEAKGELTVGEMVQLEVIGIDAEGREEPITEGLSFTTSNEYVASVDASGLVTVHSRAPVTITAKADLGEKGSFEAKIETTPICHYPEENWGLSHGMTVPPLRWNAMDPYGQPYSLRLEDVYCNLEWRGVQTLHLVFSAGWCGPCTQYAGMLSAMSKDLNALGMRIATIELDTLVPGQDADHRFAYDHLKKIADSVGAPVSGFAAGLRDTFLAGDEDNYREELRKFVVVFPTRLIVRTRDMRVIADGSANGPWSGTHFPLMDIAANPEGDWSTPDSNGEPIPTEPNE